MFGCSALNDNPKQIAFVKHPKILQNCGIGNLRQGTKKFKSTLQTQIKNYQRRANHTNLYFQKTTLVTLVIQIGQSVLAVFLAIF